MEEEVTIIVYGKAASGKTTFLDRLEKHQETLGIKIMQRITGNENSLTFVVKRKGE